MEVVYSLNDSIDIEEVVALYRANGWSSADKPERLLPALGHSHSLVTARRSGRLVGLGNAISDGHLVVYFPHLLVLPEERRKGIGRALMGKMLERYAGFHMKMLTADGDAIDFYKSMGFVRAGRTEPLWIYEGGEH